MATAWAPPLVVEPPAQEGSADAAPHGETVAHSGAAERDSAGINSPRGGVTSRGSGLLALAAEDAQHGAGSSGAGLVSSPARSSGRTSEEEEEASPGGAESGSDAASVSAAAGSSAGGAHTEKEKASKPVGARSLLNALPAGLLSLAGGGSGGGGGDSASAEEAQRLRLQIESKKWREFFGLPDTEFLLDDSFICALYKKIMHQGRLYVFDSFICFYSNVFGVERKKIIALQSVTAIVKAKTALVVPNAIEIVTLGDRRDFFTSFITLDKAYRLICAAWCNNTPLAIEFFRRQKEERDEKERAASAAASGVQAPPPPAQPEGGSEAEEDPLSKYEHPGGVIMRRATAPSETASVALELVTQPGTVPPPPPQQPQPAGDGRGLFGTIGALFKSDDKPDDAQQNGESAPGHRQGQSSMGTIADDIAEEGDTAPTSDVPASPSTTVAANGTSERTSSAAELGQSNKPLGGGRFHRSASSLTVVTASEAAPQIPPSPPAGDPPPPGARHVRVFSDGSDADAESMAEKLAITAAAHSAAPPAAQQQHPRGGVAQMQTNGRTASGGSLPPPAAVATSKGGVTRRPSAADLLELSSTAEAPHKHAYVAPAAASTSAMPEWSKGMRQIQEVDLDVSLEGLVEIVWSDEASVPNGFAASVHAIRQETELRISPWQPASSGGFQRDVTFRSPIRGPSARFGKSSTYCHVSQHCRRYGASTFVLQSSQVMNDIPYGDYFRVQFRWDVTVPKGEVARCRLRVGVEVVFLKSTFLKGTIESNTFSETSDSVKDWINAIQKQVAARKALQTADDDDDDDDADEVAAAAPPSLLREGSLRATPGGAQQQPRTPRLSIDKGNATLMSMGSLGRTPHTGGGSAVQSPYPMASPGVVMGDGGGGYAPQRGLGALSWPHILVALLLAIVAYLLGGGGAMPRWGPGFHPPPGMFYPYGAGGPPAQPYSQGWDSTGGSAAWLAGMDAYARGTGSGGGSSAIAYWDRRAQAMRDELEALDRRVTFLRAELSVAERKAADWRNFEQAERQAARKPEGG